MSSFEIEQHETPAPGIRAAEVAGELDLTNARELEETLDELSGDGIPLVLDLNRVLFVDSAALHVLFRAARTLGKERFGLVLEPTAAIARTLDIVGLPDAVTVRSTFKEVVAELEPAGSPG